MNLNQIKGRSLESVGALQQLLGRLTGNKSLETRGLLKSLLGNAQCVLESVRAQVKSRPAR